MKKIKQNIIGGLIFSTVCSIVYILVEHFVFQEEFNRKLIIAAIIGSTSAWFLILFLEKRSNQKKKYK
ncbi:hypothetical protein [Ancylomarina longa]|uniref:Uncharacterized protein n=1 Tax=Ancylomarina longa TaxID=2487017 RepID=A0A434ATK6_9BACT|nr:hypothetical protein [Ancylomarina longa]RUT77741.1 hypothetical protein DLK05_11785 [Ancylomarina longa]